MRLRRIALVIGLVVMGVVVRAGPENSDSTEAWRQAYEAKLRAPDGWLSVAGLFFLEPGANAVGTDPSNHIVLPRDSAPAHAGVVRYADDRVIFEPGPGVHPTLNGRLQTDRSSYVSPTKRCTARRIDWASAD